MEYFEESPIVVDDCSASGFLAFEDPALRIRWAIAPYTRYFNPLLHKGTSQSFTDSLLRKGANEYHTVVYINHLTQDIESIRNIPSNSCCQGSRAKFMILFRIPRER